MVGPALLANEYVEALRSPDPQRVYVTTPGLVCLAPGRLIATAGVKAVPGVALDGPTCHGEGTFTWQTRVFTSDDGGATWQQRATLPLLHGRPFVAGSRVYVLGHAGDLTIAASTDDGTTWSEAAALTHGQWWHQAACSVEYANGRVYLVMERRTHADVSRWDVSAIAPVLMAAPVDGDLLRRDTWIFSNEITFQHAVADAGLMRGLGTPFYPLHAPGSPGTLNAEAAPPRRPERSEGPVAMSADRPQPARVVQSMAPPGWLETNVVQFRDPRHIWHDPSGRTFHLFMRVHSGTTNIGAVARGVEDSAGNLTVELMSAPSGEPLVFIPFPGGHLKFHILYDAPSHLYWLAASQSTDSLVRPEQLGPGRYALPNGERHRLALHYSSNCLDWQFAGLVAVGDAPGQSRHYASLAVSSDDLLVLSRSGDAQARSAHDCNLITLHRVRDFRSLAQ